MCPPNNLPARAPSRLALLVQRVKLRLLDRKIRLVERHMAMEQAMHDTAVGQLVNELNTVIGKRAAVAAALRASAAIARQQQEVNHG